MAVTLSHRAVDRYISERVSFFVTGQDRNHCPPARVVVNYSGQTNLHQICYFDGPNLFAPPSQDPSSNPPLHSLSVGYLLRRIAEGYESKLNHQQ
jgi:hypothetical protein